MKKNKKPDFYDLALLMVLASMFFTVGFLVGLSH